VGPARDPLFFITCAPPIWRAPTGRMIGTFRNGGL